MAFLEEIEAHRAARLNRLRSKDGWLALVDRVVLDEGENVVDGGTATLAKDGAVTLQVGDAVHAWRADEKGPGPFLFAGEKRYEILRQATKVAVRVRSPDSPLLRAFDGVDFYPADERFR